MDTNVLPLTPPKAWPRFTLRTMLALMAAAAAIGAVAGWWGAWWGVSMGMLSLLVGIGAIIALFSREPVLNVTGALLAIGAIFMMFAIPAIIESKKMMRHGHCYYQLHDVAQAVTTYQGAQGHFPPAQVVDAAGRPRHSWRALVLYLLSPEFRSHVTYRAHETWDSPHNQLVAQKAGGVFHCPSNPSETDNTTDYLALVGPGSAWELPAYRLVELQDSLSRMILIVEVPNSKIIWTEPHDITIPDFLTHFQTMAKSLHEGNHDGKFCVVMADGSTRTLRYDMDLDELTAMLSQSDEPAINLPNSDRL